MFLELIREYVGVAPTNYIYLEYLFAGCLFIAFVLFVLTFASFCLKSMFKF